MVGFYGRFCQLPVEKRNEKVLGSTYSASSVAAGNNPYSNPDQVATIRRKAVRMDGIMNERMNE